MGSNFTPFATLPEVPHQERSPAHPALCASRSRQDGQPWTIATLPFRDWDGTMTHHKARNQPCCPKFDPAPWDAKTYGHNYAVALAQVE